MHLAICLLLALLCATCQANGHASSTNNVMKLCGQDFSDMYEYCCKNGFRSGKRQIIFSEGLKIFEITSINNVIRISQSNGHLQDSSFAMLKF